MTPERSVSALIEQFPRSGLPGPDFPIYKTLLDNNVWFTSSDCISHVPRWIPKPGIFYLCRRLLSANKLIDKSTNMMPYCGDTGSRPLAQATTSLSSLSTLPLRTKNPDIPQSTSHFAGNTDFGSASDSTLAPGGFKGDIIMGAPSIPELRSDSNIARPDSPPSDIMTDRERVIETMASISRTCLSASQKYLRERHINSIMRSGKGNLVQDGLSPMPSLHQSYGKARTARRRSYRHSPYSRPSPTISAGESSESHVSMDNPVDIPASLSVNMSIICTQVWEQAQRDRLHVPLVERTAVRNMGCLLEWADTVEMGPEGFDLEEIDCHDPGVLKPMLAAGKNLCLWLGFDEGATWIKLMDP